MPRESRSGAAGDWGRRESSDLRSSSEEAVVGFMELCFMESYCISLQLKHLPKWLFLGGGSCEVGAECPSRRPPNSVLCRQYISIAEMT